MFGSSNAAAELEGVTHSSQLPLRPIFVFCSGQAYVDNVVRVCVKPSLAEGRRRLYTNMAYARLLIFNRPSKNEPT